MTIMRGYRIADKSVVWADGSRTNLLGGSAPAGSYKYPPAGGGTLVEGDVVPAPGGGLQANNVHDVSVIETPSQGVPNHVPSPPIFTVPVDVTVPNENPGIVPPTVNVNPPPSTTPDVAPTPAPEVPPEEAGPLTQVQSWWNSLTGATKLVTGGAVAVAAVVLLSPGKTNR